jgi:glycosyltransferase involved in cell wall biosynthesis
LSRKLRILLVNWNDRKNPYFGGAEIHLHETFGRLAARGHEVTLLCSGFQGAPSQESLDGMSIVRVGGRYSFHLVAPFEIRRRIRRRSCDIIVEALNKIPVGSPWLGRVPVLGIGHHLFGPTIFHEVPPPFSFYIFACELGVPWIYRDAPMAVISESTREDFVERGLSPERIRIVYVGVDHDAYRPDPLVPRDEKPALLALGRVRKYKRLDLVLDAVAELGRTKYPELTLTVAGSGNYLEKLRAHARRTNAERFVRFLGRVDEEQKIDLYRRAWALVMTSPKEGWGLTCLEAQACGTPVIASDSPGLREAVRHERSGLLIPHGKRSALVSAIDRFLSDAALREQLRCGAIDFARSFTWTRCADEMERLIEETILEREKA